MWLLETLQSTVAEIWIPRLSPEVSLLHTMHLSELWGTFNASEPRALGVCGHSI